MKAASLILQLVGFLICFGSSIGFRFALGGILNAIMSSETSGIGQINSAVQSGYYLSYLNILGCVVILIGIILNIISVFVGRKQTT